MSNLTYQESSQYPGLEVVILHDGSAWVTQSSYARFVGKDQSVISRRSNNLEVVEIPENELGKFTMQFCIVNIKTRLTHKNGKTSEVILIPADIFGSWIVKDNFDLGLQIIKAGATQFLYHAVGKKVGVIETSVDSELKQLILGQQSEIAELKAMVSQLLANQVNPTSTSPKAKLIAAAPKYGEWIKDNLVVTNNENDVLLLEEIKGAIVKYSSRMISTIRSELSNFHGWVMNNHKSNRAGAERKSCMYGIRSCK